MTNYHSGDPLDIRVGSSLLNNGGGSNANWPNVTCGSIGTPHAVTQWFDTSCFADPAQYQFGTYKIGDVVRRHQSDAADAARGAVGVQVPLLRLTASIVN